jgi:hypothetical protein
MKNYDTVSEAVNDLVKRGYTTDFNIHEDGECLVCSKGETSLSPKDFEIDEIHRFEGETDPGDEMIVFAISSSTLGVKGIVVNAYGIYSDANTAKIVKYLSGHVS